MQALAIARRFWPELETMSGQPQVTGVANVVGFLAALPLDLAGLAWLLAVTDLALIRREWPVLLGVGVLLLLAEQLRFFVFVQVEPGT